MMPVGRHLRKFIAPLHGKFRTEKVDRFFRELRPQPEDTLLDVGGGVGIVGEFGALYQYFRTVQIVNLDSTVVVGDQFSNVTVSIADGCALPFPDRSFDWVFSNAVIEHVGGMVRQQQFASEIRRVARKGYFVATPNRHFPVDPHTLLPFYQFLSPRLQGRVCRFSPGYLREYEPIDLLSYRSLQALFPGAMVQKLGMKWLPNNLIAYRRLVASQ